MIEVNLPQHLSRQYFFYDLRRAVGIASTFVGEVLDFQTNKTEFHEWLDDNCPDRYKIVTGDGSLLDTLYVVEFNNRNDALMFKLVWGGE